jgi:hypothetical protein
MVVRSTCDQRTDQEIRLLSITHVREFSTENKGPSGLLGYGILDHGDRRNVTKLAGNICRSPMGEAVLRHTAQKRGMSILVDSCGTAGYHVGEEPDERWVIHIKFNPRTNCRLAIGQSKPVKR